MFNKTFKLIEELSLGLQSPFPLLLQIESSFELSNAKGILSIESKKQSAASFLFEQMVNGYKIQHDVFTGRHGSKMIVHRGCGFEKFHHIDS